MLYSSVNFFPQSEISIQDRGLAFGDGVFTTAQIIDGKVQWLEQHIERLQLSCGRLYIESPDFDKLKTHLEQVCVPFKHAVLKVIITTGNSGRGYARSPSVKPNVIVIVSDYPGHYPKWREEGITLGVAETQLGLNPQLSGIKHLNRLEQVLVRRELEQSGYEDLVVCDINGYVVETSSCNLFWQLDGIWHTADLSESGVQGLASQRLLNQLGNVKIVRHTIEQLQQADSMFICNALLRIAPVSQFLDRQLSTTLSREVKEFF
ncbi:aminodeoxychorismate lyase [Thalassotalea sp. PS06]|uniref:aminodeoxychorismate lyase n=1 Tax=Thalassotalea sp. PS06 TaxID=2594005 RepID=UPI001164F532|nr:aminodeoxychorismate lyase [Thalassotalea sp. PS06]QDP01137.1 aminodeoxychorismate lyase [Thalassotalea sp. PS06]